MPIEIKGVIHFTACDVAREVGISRQTLWRWRQNGKVPPGRRYRDHQVLFTDWEMEQIRDYANRLEPSDADYKKDLKALNPRRNS